MLVVKAGEELSEGMWWRGPGGGSRFGRGVAEEVTPEEGGNLQGEQWLFFFNHRI